MIVDIGQTGHALTVGIAAGEVRLQFAAQDVAHGLAARRVAAFGDQPIESSGKLR